MSILIYRDTDGRTITIKSPSEDDWVECCRVIARANRQHIKESFLREMSGSLVLQMIGGQDVS